METDNTEQKPIPEEAPSDTPVCLGCIKPIDPLGYYCNHCGKASNPLTQYIPFVNIRWKAYIWGRVWRQVWSREVSVPGRIFRFIMIIWNAPIMFIGLLFREKKKTEN